MTQLMTRQESVEETIARLERFVLRMEGRYEVPSSEVAAAVKSGAMRETAEVGRWLTSYRTLLRLRERSGAKPR